METLAELGDETFARIRALMHSAIGVSFSREKKALVCARLGARIQRLGLGGFDEYVDLISGDDGGEFQVAVDLLTTNETYFFREPAHFDHLERELARTRPRQLSVWSAASSFGDEAYSVAMLLADMQSSGQVGDDWSILGTDISDRVLRAAVDAVYPEDRLRHVSTERLKRYCLRGEGDASGLVLVQPRLTERVRFGQLNLCQPIERLGPFDVVFLRNVLIYFDQRTKADVLNRVLACLRPGGLLFVGTADGRPRCEVPLQFVAPGIHRKPAAQGSA